MSIPPGLAEALTDRYTVEREAGAGGMAVVYMADDRRHDRKVAIKVLRPELASIIGAERFLREIQIAARLQHPHILPLFDSGEAVVGPDRLLYFTMPWVEGASLRERLDHSGELPTQESVRLLMEIVDALAYAHAHGVVHRDIKPDNIMLSGRHALVMDFGVAKAVSDATGYETLTAAGVTLGTPAYMAPEQAAADPHLDHRADIYAVGAMAYELLSGRPPFVGGTAQQVLAAHVTQAVEPLSRHRPTVPPALEAVVMRCLEKRPADRWQTANELLAELERAVPSGATLPTVERSASPRRVRSRRAWWGAAAAAVGIAALWWAFRPMHSSAAVLQPDDAQLTFTGNASAPSVSADGRRMAYFARRCDSVGQCLVDLKIQDIGGTETATLVRGLINGWGTQWTADGRYLLFDASMGVARWGAFSVSTLGGEPTYLGCCAATLIGRGDTALVSGGAVVDSVWRLRRVLTADGTLLDSMTMLVRGGPGLIAAMSGDGRWMLVYNSVFPNSRSLTIATPSGAAVDSLHWPAEHAIRYPPIPIPGSPAFVLLIPSGGAGNQLALVKYRIGRTGHLSGGDTVARDLSMALSIVGTNAGMLPYSYGAIRFQVASFSLGSPARLPPTLRPLAEATVIGLEGRLSPDGHTVLLARARAGMGDSLVQLSLVPSDSGPERTLGPAADYRDFDLSADAVFTAVRRGGSMQVRRVRLADGASELMRTYPVGQYGSLKALPGGGFLMLAAGGDRLERVGAPGSRDTAFTLPTKDGRAVFLDPSPDGTAVALTGWDASSDSIFVRRISLANGSVSRVGAFPVERVTPPRWLTDGSMLLPVAETGSTLALYRFPPSGGPPVRLGFLTQGNNPEIPITYSFSADGTRGLARTVDRNLDVHVIRNFGEMVR